MISSHAGNGDSILLQQAIHKLPTKPNRRLDHLPGDYGLPLFGHTWGLLTNGPRLTERMVARYGPVFRSSALFQRSVGLVACQALFQEILGYPDFSTCETQASVDGWIGEVCRGWQIFTAANNYSVSD